MITILLLRMAHSVVSEREIKHGRNEAYSRNGTFDIVKRRHKAVNRDLMFFFEKWHLLCQIKLHALLPSNFLNNLYMKSVSSTTTKTTGTHLVVCSAAAARHKPQ